jgi:hypothetical protein
MTDKEILSIPLSSLSINENIMIKKYSKTDKKKNMKKSSLRKKIQQMFRRKSMVQIY